MVFVLEGFPVGVDRRQSDLGGVKGVDPQVGRAAGMGLFADVADQLASKPVVSAARLSETAVLQQAGDGERWCMTTMSTSSKRPSLINSCLPPRKVILPSFSAGFGTQSRRIPQRGWR